MPMLWPSVANSMIKFNLKWWMNTNHFVQGMPIHPPDPNVFLYMDASHYGWGAHLELTSLSFHGRWSEDQSQLHINILEIMAICFALKKALKYIHHSCVMISSNNTTVVSCINKQGGTHSPNLCVEVWKVLHWCLEQHIVVRVRHIPGKFSVLADLLSRMDKPLKTEWALDQSIANSIFQMFNYPNVDLFATRFNHKLPLYVSPVLDNQALAIDAEPSLCLCISSNNIDSFCPGQDTSVSVQNSSYSLSLAPTTVVLRGMTTTSFSSSLSSALSKTTDISKM